MRGIFLNNKINPYFFFMTVAFAVSVYLLVMSGNYSYVSELDILLTPKNVKTAMYIKDIKSPDEVLSHVLGNGEENEIND